MSDKEQKEAKGLIYDTENLVESAYDNGADGEATGAEKTLEDAMEIIARAKFNAESQRAARANSGIEIKTALYNGKTREGDSFLADRERAKRVAEERMAAMSYAEEYRKKIRAEKENAALLKKQKAQSEAEASREKEREEREKEILANTLKERSDAKARSEKAWDLLTRVDKSVSVISADEDVRGSAGEEKEKADCIDSSASETEQNLSSNNSFAEKVADGVCVDETSSDRLEEDLKDGEEGIISLEESEGANILHIDGAVIGGVAAGIVSSSAGADAGGSYESAAGLGYGGAEAADKRELPDLFSSETKGEEYRDPSFVFIPRTAHKNGDGSLKKKRLSDEEAMRALDEENYKRILGAVPASQGSSGKDCYSELGYDAKGEILSFDAEDKAEIEGVPFTRADVEFRSKEKAEFGDESQKVISGYEAHLADKESSVRVPDTAEVKKSTPSGSLLSEKDLEKIRDFEQNEAKLALSVPGGKAKKTSGADRAPTGVGEALTDASDAENELLRFADEADSLKDKRSYKEDKKNRLKEEQKALLGFAKENANEEKARALKDKPVARASENAEKSGFDTKGIRALVESQRKNDVAYIKERFAGDLRQLKLEKGRASLRFSDETKKDKRIGSKRKLLISNSKKEMRRQIRLEELDNDRYYYLVSLDIEGAKLPGKCDRERLKRLREELMNLLHRRDEINTRLCELYSGTDGSSTPSDELLDKAEANGMKKCFKRYKGLVRRIEKMRVELSKKQEIYRTLDRQTEVYGKIKRLECLLKKRKVKGDLRRESKRELKKLKNEYRFNEKAIERQSVRAMRTADARNKSARASVFGWICLMLLVAAGVAVYVFWPQILGFIKGLLGGGAG